VIYFRDLFRRLLQSRRWIAAQFGLTLLLILIGIVWTRLPEKHVWQVLLSLLLPLLIAISALELQAGTMRSLANGDGKRVKLPWGAISLLFWIAVAWLCWAILDWCDDRIYQWAGYLNSQAPAHWRAKFLTFPHLSLWMTCIEWVLRWIVVPAKIIPFAIASAQSGWRLPVRRVLQLLWNWRWWLGVIVVALVSVALPSHFYSADPHGTVHAQIWRVSLKLTGSYLLGVAGWVLLLAWVGVLFGRQKPLPESDAVTELFDRMCVSRRWVAAQFGWVILFGAAVFIGRSIPNEFNWKNWIIGLSLLVLFALWTVLQAGMLRSLLIDSGRRVRMIQGILSMLLWMVLMPVAAFTLSLWHTPIATWLVGWVAAPAILLPFVFASLVWGLILPWKRVLRFVIAWRWWVGVFFAALGAVLVVQISSNVFSTSGGLAGLNFGVALFIELGIWLLLLGWFAVLFNRTVPPAPDAPVSTSATAE